MSNIILYDEPQLNWLRFVDWETGATSEIIGKVFAESDISLLVVDEDRNAHIIQCRLIIEREVI